MSCMYSVCKFTRSCIASEQTILQKLDLHEAPPKQEFHMSNFLNTFTLEGGKIITRDNSVGRHPELIHDVQSDVWLYKAGTSTTWTLSFLWVRSLKWNLFRSISSSIFTKGNKLFFSSFLSLLFPTVIKVNKIQMTPFLGSTSIQCLPSVSVIDGHELLARYHSELGCQGNIIIIKFCIESKWLHFICTFTSLLC